MIDPFDCPHTFKKPVLCCIANGQTQVREQCQRCGLKVGVALRRALFGDLQMEDRQLSETCERAIEKRNKNFIADRDRKNADWWAHYDCHINSEKWQTIRRKVFRRANGLCEGCAEHPPTEVHHLSYAHLGDEFLTELAAFCEPCHDRWHDREPGETNAAQRANSIGDAGARLRRARLAQLAAQHRAKTMAEATSDPSDIPEAHYGDAP